MGRVNTVLRAITPALLRVNPVLRAIVIALFLVTAGVGLAAGVFFLVVGNEILPEVAQSVTSTHAGASSSMRRLVTTLDQQWLVSIDRPKVDAAFDDLDRSFNKIESEIRNASGTFTTLGVVSLVLGLAFGVIGFVMQLRQEVSPAASVAAIPGGAVAQGGQ